MKSTSASPLRLAIGGMVGMAVAMGIGRFVYTPLLPSMMDGLSMPASDAGLIASANYLGYLAGAVIASGGWAARRERPLMLVGLAASALLCAAMGLTESLPAFLAIRFLAGLASAFLMIFLSTIVFSHLAEHRRADLQALHFGGVGIGIMVSAITTAGLVIADAPWPVGWLWAGAISAAGFVFVALAIDRGPATAAGSQKHQPRLPNNPDLVRLIIAYGLFGFGYIVTATFLVAIVRQGESGRMFEASVWMAAGAAGIPSVWLWSRITARLRLIRTFAVACVVEAIGVTASVSMGGHAGPLIAGVLLGGTFIAITAIGLQAGRLLAPAAPRRALALMTASFGLGQIIGPIVAGVIADFTGGFTLASLVAALALLAAAVLALFTRTRF